MTTQKPTTPLPQATRLPLHLKVAALLALVFGAATVLSGGSVLFGPDAAQVAAGAYVPFVLWFNFCAGFFYIAAAVGIWLGRGWALGLSGFIAAATALVAAVFGLLVIRGDAYEIRTVAALVLRIGVWTAISVAIYRTRRRS